MTRRLTHYRYIKNFDSKQLNVGIWRYGCQLVLQKIKRELTGSQCSGDLRLRNLELKKEVCLVGSY